MAFRTNYRFERAERDRLKKAKKDEKLKRQQERAASRQDDGSPEQTENERRAGSLVRTHRDGHRRSLGQSLRPLSLDFAWPARSPAL